MPTSGESYWRWQLDMIRMESLVRWQKALWRPEGQG